MDIGTREPGTYLFASIKLDPVQRIVMRDGTKLNLTPRLFDILLYLVHNNQRVVSREELQREIWGSRTMESNNLPVAISSLRKALPAEEAGSSLIATIPGEGYRITAAVTFEAAKPQQKHFVSDGASPAPCHQCSQAAPLGMENRRPRRRPRNYLGSIGYRHLALRGTAAINHGPGNQAAGRRACSSTPM